METAQFNFNFEYLIAAYISHTAKRFRLDAYMHIESLHHKILQNITIYIDKIQNIQYTIQSILVDLVNLDLRTRIRIRISWVWSTMVIELMHFQQVRISPTNATVRMLPKVWIFTLLALENLGIGGRSFRGRS